MSALLLHFLHSVNTWGFVSQVSTMNPRQVLLDPTPVHYGQKMGITRQVARVVGRETAFGHKGRVGATQRSLQGSKSAACWLQHGSAIHNGRMMS